MKQTYRATRRHGALAAGDEVELTEAEAQALNNEAPGVLERIAAAEKEPERAARLVVSDEPVAKPKERA